MKEGLSLQDLAAKIQRQSDAKKDFIVDTRELTLLTARDEENHGVLSELHLPQDEGEYVVNSIAEGQIGTHLGIPRQFYRRLFEGYPGLLDQNVNTLLRGDHSKRMIRAFDYGDEKIARAFLSDRYRRLDNDELAQAFLGVVADIPDVRVVSSEITDRRMYIKVVAPRIEGEVKQGDVVQAGVMCSNSEVGHGALKIVPFIYRLVCLNGMISTDATKHYHVGRQIDSEETLKVLSDSTVKLDDAAFFSKIADVTKAAVDETRFNAIVGNMRLAAQGQTMDKPIEAMERLAKRFDLNDGEKDGVFKHLIEGADLSRWGALNAVTRFSADVESYDRATELEEVGGKVLDMNEKEWAAVAATA